MTEGGRRPEAGLGPVAQATVQRAWGQRDSAPAGAAADYERLAKMAGDRGMFQMATYFAVECARVQIRSGSSGSEQITAGLGFATQARSVPKATRRFADLIAELRAGGNATADAVETEVKTKLGLTVLPIARVAPPMNRSQRRNLPVACPVCAAAADYDVLFHEDGTAECRYCGSTLA